MGSRLALNAVLEDLIGNDNVYFQPPPTMKMKYCCIVYQRDFADTKFADNKPYSHVKRYSVTVIDQDPDSDIPDKVATLPMCVFDRFFTVGNLNHFVYKLFF